MPAKKSPSKPKRPAKQETGGGCPGATCSAFICPVMTLIDPVNGGPIEAVHAEDYHRIVEVLKKIVAFDDLMNDPTWEGSGTYSGAYYAYYKGNSEAWKEARSFLPNAKHTHPPTQDHE